MGKEKGEQGTGLGTFLLPYFVVLFLCFFFFRVCRDLFFDLSFYVYFFKDVFGILLYSILIGKQGIARVEPRWGSKNLTEQRIRSGSWRLPHF